MSRMLIFILFSLFLAWYAFQAIRTLYNSRLIFVVYWILTLVVLINLAAQFQNPNSFQNDIRRSYAIGFYIVLVSTQAVLISVLLMEDIGRFFRAIVVWLSPSKAPIWEGRRAFVSTLAVALAAVPFSALLFGMVKGKYNYKVLKYQLEFDRLPDAFEGYRVVHISDMHAGSFDNEAKVQYGIDLINEQNADVVLFTGDLVNNRASELERWKHIFKGIRANEGVFSVLGNHDYGDYVSWSTKEEKDRNFNLLLEYQSEMGFHLLRNEHFYLRKNNQKIALVGVENWGTGGFVKKGDLNKALEGTQPDDFTILLSHDPTHWEMKVKDYPFPVPLTLSGHTHGMQFGIEIPGWIKWSPVKWRYKYWAGVYNENQRYLNVNRGFGYLAYPGRVGIWPEISVITLRQKG